MGLDIQIDVDLNIEMSFYIPASFRSLIDEYPVDEVREFFLILGIVDAFLREGT